MFESFKAGVLFGFVCLLIWGRRLCGLFCLVLVFLMYVLVGKKTKENIQG